MPDPTGSSSTGRSTQLELVEHWFARRGVPHFIAQYDARTDIWTRAIPLLVIAYVLGGLNALNLTAWSVVENLAAVAVVLAILVGTWALANRLRRRPFLAWPREVGPFELAVFVLGPAVPSIALGQGRDALEAVAEGLAVLAVIYVVTSYGILSLLGWAAGRAASQLVLFINTVTRVLPFLLLFITFLFINAEVWQMAGTLSGWRYWAVLAIFLLLGVVFVMSRTPPLMRSLATFGDWTQVRELIVDTPAAELGPLPPAGPPDAAELTRRERFNIALVSILSQGIQVTLVALAVFAFFVVFGMLAIPADTIRSWTGLTDVRPLIGDQLVLTEPLLRVAGFLAAFTGMYFTVLLSTDATYREEFAEDVAPQIRQALAVRMAYRHVLGSVRAAGAE